MDDRLILLPTPVAHDSGNTPEDHLRKKPGREVVTSLTILIENGLLETGGRLLPTPTTAPSTGNGHARNLGGEVRALLPTPTAQDCAGSRGHRFDGTPYGPTSGTTLTDAAWSATRTWGPYEPAVRRWEHLTRPAPSPLDDKGRLNPLLPEWMMGLPEGWVTDLLPRSPALRAIGNGVLPAQAVAAYRTILAADESLGAMS